MMFRAEHRDEIDAKKIADALLAIILEQTDQPD